MGHRAGGLAVRAENPGQSFVQHVHPRRVVRAPARSSGLVDGQDRSQVVNHLVGGDGFEGVDLKQGEFIGAVAPVKVALLDPLRAVGLG